MKLFTALIRIKIENTSRKAESEGSEMEDLTRLKRMLLFVSTFGLAVFTMVVVTEIVSLFA